MFIFVAAILLMPLCNNLYDLVSRDQVGWALYAVVLACIIFNILILLLRSCSIFCEYVKARSELIKRIAAIRVDNGPVDDEPFKAVEELKPTRPEASSLQEEIMNVKVYPQARDFTSFGLAQNVTNSITSMEIEREDDRDRMGVPMFDDILIDEAEKPVPAAQEEEFSMKREIKKKTV